MAWIVRKDMLQVVTNVNTFLPICNVNRVLPKENLLITLMHHIKFVFFFFGYELEFNVLHIKPI